ncbi:enoyl-CoA hydratase/isomerase family protein [Streptomyces hoynatensis]|uniref:Enoyl-CoA hydratase/isomerase family protein n=1 Tax=Streptomyces hoynatensis TaxID=1141874 RepID=A0A3A9YWC1_9ACTN|nr:enoyl-CoA hydratase/isomerase family protein [Streptomyces hoynatensis]RKN39516.1 enoyl-CoA hydratase/isomerase family protein [Streptomyces hoynatensis]
MSLISTERQGAVLIVRFDNEPFNFLNDRVLVEYHRVLDRVEADRSLRAVVLSGTQPGIFINHFDIEELIAGAERGGVQLSPRAAAIPLRAVAGLGRIPGMGRLLDRGPTAGLRALLRFHDAVRRMRDSDATFVAAIDGHSYGGGFELALACDVRIIGDGPFYVGLLEITLDLIPGGGGSQLLTHLLGAGDTVAALLEGRLFTPAQAHQAGLAQRLVERDDVVAEALETAARLARRSPGAVRFVKQAVYQGGFGRTGRGLAMERNRFMGLASRRATLDALRAYLAFLKEQPGSGLDPAAFLSKRLPEWQGSHAANSTGFIGSSRSSQLPEGD